MNLQGFHPEVVAVGSEKQTERLSQKPLCPQASPLLYRVSIASNCRVLIEVKSCNLHMKQSRAISSNAHALRYSIEV